MMEPAEFQQAVLDRLDGLDGRPTGLDDYVRNHLTSKMDRQFGEVNDGIAIVSNLLQEHVLHGGR